jgi:predicted chitinase
MTTDNQAVKPLLAVKYPFVTEDGKEFSDLDKLLTELGQQSGGYYLLGANNCWHGGIHITDEKFAHHKTTHPVRCMMDGVVIAYRLNKNYPTQKWQANSTLPAADLKFSNGFCLIKHEYESPANQTEGENKGKTNKLTFYSLYMHLADYQTYVPDSTNQEKTVAISKDTNARDTANINHKLGELTSGSTVKVDTQQQPYKAKINGKFYKYYRGTVVNKAADSTASIAVGALVYLYANCFPAGTFSTAEKPRFPSYWKATVTGKSKEPMKVYRTEQACKSRTTPHDALLNEQQTVTFESGQVKSATINGKTHKIAPCQIANTATFAHNVRLDEGWMIVDESQVSWEKVEPTEFDNIVKLSEPLPISAGDPVGFMGIWESPEEPIAAGTTKTKYQMHVELFTANDKAALDQFLNNEAKLTSGKKYLKVPKGTQLYASNGHGNYVYVHESLFAARDYVVAESDCSQMKDTAGTIFYQLKQIRTGEAALGPVDLYYVKIEGNVKLVTQYDWKELGFSTLEETNDDADGYINPEKVPSDLFKDIFKRVDGINSRNGQGDGNLTGKEIKDALQQDKDLRNDLYKMIAGHPSEWHSTTQNNIKKMYETIKAENTEEEYKNATQFEIDRFLKCEFVSQIDGLTQKLWHFHPIVALNNCTKKDAISFDVLKKLAPNTNDDTLKNVLDGLNENLNAYAINTKYRICHFLSQLAVENGFNISSENLSYSAKRMREIFGCKGGSKNYSRQTDECSLGRLRNKLWTEESNYEHNPENLGNYVYADRYKNGAENSGDGYKYRGRGLIQLTFRGNYQDFTISHNEKHPTDIQDFEQTPDLVATNYKYAVEAAFYFWRSRDINSLSDGTTDDDVKKITRAVNGGANGLQERIDKFRLAMELL